MSTDSLMIPKNYHGLYLWGSGKGVLSCLFDRSAPEDGVMTRVDGLIRRHVPLLSSHHAVHLPRMRRGPFWPVPKPLSMLNNPGDPTIYILRSQGYGPTIHIIEGSSYVSLLAGFLRPKPCSPCRLIPCPVLGYPTSW